MQPRLLSALLALHAIAVAHTRGEYPIADVEGIVVEDGVELDSNFIVDPIFDILSNNTTMPNIPDPAVAARQAPPSDPTTVTAEVAAKIEAPGGGVKGVFYRGDSRPPSFIFTKGFAPQGGDKSLRNHLSFVGNSGLVSLSRSPETAESYAFGRSGEKTTKGYIYVISPKDVPDGYWVPGIYTPKKNPAVARNQEFAVAGSVPATSISHAYEVTGDKPSSRRTKIMNPDYVLKKSRPCGSSGLGKRTTCGPAKYTPKTATGRPVRTKVSTNFRAGARAGGAVAFAALSPYAHDVLDLVKSWDHPIGHAVSWFDSSMASLQETIGGQQVPEIYGNTLKLRLICWIRGEQRHKSHVDYACDRLRAASQKPELSPESKRLESINDVLDVCDKVDDRNTSLSNELKYELQDRCQVFREMVDKAAKPPFVEVPEADKKAVAGDSDGIPANTIVEDKAATQEAVEVMGLYTELFHANLSFSGHELCWSAFGLRSFKPSGWDLVSSALVYFEENGQGEVPCRACQKEDQWALRCGAIAR
ncbi:hypothetical protein V2A60_008450 [Cordyceps javanica]